MTGWWLALSLLGPAAAAAGATVAYRSRPASPLAIIGLNAVAPGAGLAAAHRPTLEVVLAVMFAQASLLVTGGPADAAFLLPIAVIGGLWGSWHTPLNPVALAAADRPRRDFRPNRSDGAEPDSPAASAPEGPAGEQADGGSPEPLGYAITVRCTECGAAVEVPVLAHMAQCSFCGSRHLVVGQDETLWVTLPERVVDEQTLRGAVLDHYRHIHYLELYRRTVAPLERGSTEASESGVLVTRPEVDVAVAAAEAAASRKADSYRSSLAATLQVRALHHFLAPYRHGVGTLYQVAFGRSRPDMDKRLRFAVATIEAARLATTAMELPRMGKLSYLRALCPAAACEPELRTLPLDVDESELRSAFGDLDRKRLVRELDVIRLGVAFSPEVSAVIWRPWWIAEAAGAGTDETLLVDGAAASVVGPAPPVDGRLLERLPEPARNPGAGLRFIPMECPTCGHEYPFDIDAALHFCTNCHRVCRVDGSRKVLVEYSFEEPSDGEPNDVVPFWCFPLRLRTGDGKVITDMTHLKDGIDGRLDQIGDDAPERRHLVLAPAFRCVNSRLMGAAFERVFRYTFQSAPRLVHDRFPLTERPRPWSVNLDEEEARRLLPLYLAHGFGPRDLARVKVDQVARWIFDATQEATGRLTFLEVPRAITEPFRNYVGRYHSQAVRHARRGSEQPTARL